MAPVLAFVIQPLVEHIHYLVEIARASGPASQHYQGVIRAPKDFNSLVKGQSGDLSHFCASRAPWIIARCCGGR